MTRGAAPTLAEAVAVDGGGGRYARVLDDHWAFFGRMFGGYTAALVVGAAVRESPFPELLSANVVFLRAVEPGPVEIEVEEMRAGRGAWVGRAVLRQDGAPAALADVWTAPAGTLALAAAVAAEPGGTPLSWLQELWPFMRAFDERGVDYPTGPDTDVPEPPARIRVWVRAGGTLAVSTPLERQLFTLMVFDLHVIDAAVRPRASIGSWGLSHNLTVHWIGLPESDGWYEVAAEAIDGGATAATRGSLAGAGGDFAWALQQGRVVPVEPRP